MGCHFFLQGILPTQGSNPGLLHGRQILYHLSHQVPQSWRLEASSLGGEVVRSPEPLEEEACSPLSFWHVPRCSLALVTRLQSPSIFTLLPPPHGSLAAHDFSSLLIWPTVIWTRAHPRDLVINLSLQRTYFQIEPHSQVLGIGTTRYLF